MLSDWVETFDSSNRRACVLMDAESARRELKDRQALTLPSRIRPGLTHVLRGLILTPDALAPSWARKLKQDQVLSALTGNSIMLVEEPLRSFLDRSGDPMSDAYKALWSLKFALMEREPNAKMYLEHIPGWLCEGKLVPELGLTRTFTVVESMDVFLMTLALAMQNEVLSTVLLLCETNSKEVQDFIQSIERWLKSVGPLPVGLILPI